MKRLNATSHQKPLSYSRWENFKGFYENFFQIPVRVFRCHLPIIGKRKNERFFLSSFKFPKPGKIERKPKNSSLKGSNQNPPQGKKIFLSSNPEKSSESAEQPYSLVK